MRAIVFCTTCRVTKDKKTNDDGVTGGELLAREMESLLKETGRSEPRVARQECLWSCTQHCNVLMADSDRFSYLAGRFEPTRASAEAILEWFDLHGQSAEGAVSFREWPDGMRGHFIARLPAETMVE